MPVPRRPSSAPRSRREAATGQLAAQQPAAPVPFWFRPGSPTHVAGSWLPPLGPEDPGLKLGRLSRSRLGSSYGRVQVRSYIGHDLLGAAGPRVPAALAAGAALAALGWGRGPDGDLVPGDLLVDGDGHGAPPIGRVWPNLPAWEAGANFPARLRGRGPSCGLVAPRLCPVVVAALAGAPAGPVNHWPVWAYPAAGDAVDTGGAGGLMVDRWVPLGCPGAWRCQRRVSRRGPARRRRPCRLRVGAGPARW